MNHYAVKNLFGIEGLNIAWYGIIITFGMILGFMLALRRCKKTGVEPDHLYNLVLWLIPVCILCARAYYVLFEWEQYKDNLLSVFQINKGGLAIYGGILGGVAVVLIYCKVKKLSFWSLADTLIPALFLDKPSGVGGIELTIVVMGCRTNKYFLLGGSPALCPNGGEIGCDFAPIPYKHSSFPDIPFGMSDFKLFCFQPLKSMLSLMKKDDSPFFRSESCNEAY